MERGREDEGVLRACFEVKQVAFNLTAAESGDLTDFSAEEYLSWVAHQARTLPDVVRVNGPPLMEESCNRSGPYREEEEEGVVELDLLPDRSWEAEFLARFLSLKESLQGQLEQSGAERKVVVPAMKDTRAWAAFCFGDLNDLNDDDDPSQSYEEEDPVINFEVENGRINNESHNEGVELMRHLKRRKLELSRRQDDDETRWKGEVNVAPTVTLLAQFDQVLSQRLLGMHTEWVLKGKYLSNDRALWLFALLCRLETPLCRDTVATIRTLYKRLCHLRRQALSGIDDSNLARLNILIAITGGYFGQGESYSSLYLNCAQMEEPALFEEPNSLPDPFSVSGFDNSSAEEGELLDAETL